MPSATPADSPPAHGEVLHGAAHLPALDGLRGWAILLVVVQHFFMSGGGESLLTRDTNPVLILLGKVVLHGNRGVDLFFVLSGFLITGILLDTKGQPGYWRNFYARRALRIFPLYYLCLTAVFIVVPLLFASRPEVRTPLATQAWFWLYGANFMNFYPVASFPIGTGINLNHFWSLAVEEQFYIVWPWLVVWLSSRRLAGVCLGLILGAPLVRLLMLQCGYVEQVPTFTLARVDALACGALLATVVRADWVTGATLLRWARRACFLLLPCLVVLVLWPRSRRGVVTGMFDFSAFDVFFAAVLVLSLAARPPVLVRRLVDNRCCRLLGRYSYGLYVYHGLLFAHLPVLFSVDRLRPYTGGVFLLALLLHIILCGGASLVLALVSWHLFENPILRLKKHFAPRSSPPAPGLRRS